jgi:hypothetical protein
MFVLEGFKFKKLLICVAIVMAVAVTLLHHTGTAYAAEIDYQADHVFDDVTSVTRAYSGSYDIRGYKCKEVMADGFDNNTTAWGIQVRYSDNDAWVDKTVSDGSAFSRKTNGDYYWEDVAAQVRFWIEKVSDTANVWFRYSGNR